MNILSYEVEYTIRSIDYIRNTILTVVWSFVTHVHTLFNIHMLAMLPYVKKIPLYMEIMVYTHTMSSMT